MSDSGRDGGNGIGPVVDAALGGAAEYAGLADEILALRMRQTAMLDQIGELRVRLERSERLLDAVGSLWAELRTTDGVPASSSDGWLDLVETDRLLDGATDLEEAVRIVARCVFGAAVDVGVGVCLVEDPRTLRIHAQHGFRRSAVDAFVLMDLDERLPPTDAFRTGAAVWVRDHQDLMLRYPHVVISDSRFQSVAAVPMVADGARIGALAVWFTYPQDFDMASRVFFLALAERFALLADTGRAPDRTSA